MVECILVALRRHPHTSVLYNLARGQEILMRSPLRFKIVSAPDPPPPPQSAGLP